MCKRMLQWQWQRTDVVMANGAFVLGLDCKNKLPEMFSVYCLQVTLRDDYTKSPMMLCYAKCYNMLKPELNKMYELYNDYGY